MQKKIKSMQKNFFKKLTPFPKAPKKGETKEGEKGLNKERREKTQKLN